MCVVKLTRTRNPPETPLLRLLHGCSLAGGCGGAAHCEVLVLAPTDAQLKPLAEAAARQAYAFARARFAANPGGGLSVRTGPLPAPAATAALLAEWLAGSTATGAL